MLKRNKHITSLISKTLTFLLISSMIPIDNSLTVLASTQMGVNAQSMGADNAIKLSWNTMGNNYNYMVYSKGPGESEFQSIPTKTNIKVLNVYPKEGADSSGNRSDNLETWMETNGYGQGKIEVDKVYIDNFNNNPSNYLGTSHNWKYDVVYFGAWDSYGGKDLNESSSNLMKTFAEEGRGILIGHDTIRWDDGKTPVNPYFDKLSSYLKLTGGGPKWGEDTLKGSDSYVTIRKKGLLTNYPWNIGDVGTVLQIPNAHNVGQVANGDIWMDFNNVASNSHNFYLTTWNNAAMIQTGHSSGKATEDEQKLTANTLFYLAQVTENTIIEDHKAQDFAAPNNVYPNKTSTKNGTLNVSWEVATDKGSKYQYYVKAMNGSNYKNSETITATNTSGIKGYSYVVDNNPTTEPDNEIDTTGTSFDISLSGLDVTKKIYIHLKTIDNAGNVSTTTHTEYSYQNATDAKSIVEQLLMNFNATNSTKDSDVLSYIKNNEQFINTGFNIDFAEGTFNNKNSDYDNEGLLTGTLVLNDGITNSTVSLNKTIGILEINQTDLINAINGVSKAENEKTQENIDAAQVLIDKLPSCNKKDELQKRLDNAELYMNAEKKVIIAENSKLDSDISLAQEKVDLITDKESRDYLQTRLDDIRQENAEKNNAEEAVSKAEMTKSQADVDTARDIVSTLSNTELKNGYTERLDRVQEYINNLNNATKAVINAETTKTQIDVDFASTLVNALPDDSNKTNLLERLEKIQSEININTAAIKSVEKAEETKSQTDIDTARGLVDKVSEPTLKKNLTDRLDAIQNYINDIEEAEKFVKKAEETKSQTDIDTAREKVENLPDGEEKTSLTDRLNSLQDELDKFKKAEESVSKAETTKNSTDISNAQTLVKELPESSEKTNLQERLDKLNQYLSKVDEVEKAVSKAETTKSPIDIDAAQTLVDKLPDGNEKNAFQIRLDALNNSLSTKDRLEELISNLEKTHNEDLISGIQIIIDTLPDGTEKSEYQSRVNAVKKYLNTLKEAIKAVEKAEDSKIQTDVNSAKTLIDAKLPAGNDKTQLTDRLNAVQNYINKNKEAEKLVIKAENSKLQTDVDNARVKVNQLEESFFKTELTNRLDAIQSGIDNLSSVISAIEKAEESLSQEDVDAARKLIEDNNIKSSSLNSRLDKVQKYIDDLKAAREAVEKAERTKLQTDKNYAVPLVEAVSKIKYPVERADFLRRLQVVQDYINSVNDATYDVSKSEIQQDKGDVDNAKDTVSTLPSADSEIGLENKPCINPDEDATTDKDKLQSSLNKTETYLNDVEIADKAVKKAEASNSQDDVDEAQALINALPKKNSNLQTRLNVVKKNITNLENAQKAVEKAEDSLTQSTINAAKTAINKVYKGSERDSLQERIDLVQQTVTNIKSATTSVVKAERTKKQADFDKAKDLVDSLIDCSDKEKLLNRLDKIVIK